MSGVSLTEPNPLIFLVDHYSLRPSPHASASGQHLCISPSYLLHGHHCHHPVWGKRRNEGSTGTVTHVSSLLTSSPLQPPHWVHGITILFPLKIMEKVTVAMVILDWQLALFGHKNMMSFPIPVFLLPVTRSTNHIPPPCHVVSHSANHKARFRWCDPKLLHANNRGKYPNGPNILLTFIHQKVTSVKNFICFCLFTVIVTVVK